MLFALWNGGTNYAPSSPPEDTEVFSSLQAVKNELQARYNGRAELARLDGTRDSVDTPTVERDSEFIVWEHGDGTQFPDSGTRVFFGPRGGIKTEWF